jgi:hypothetical protein
MTGQNAFFNFYDGGGLVDDEGGDLIREGEESRYIYPGWASEKDAKRYMRGAYNTAECAIIPLDELAAHTKEAEDRGAAAMRSYVKGAVTEIGANRCRHPLNEYDNVHNAALTQALGFVNAYINLNGLIGDPPDTQAHDNAIFNEGVEAAVEACEGIAWFSGEDRDCVKEMIRNLKRGESAP